MTRQQQRQVRQVQRLRRRRRRRLRLVAPGVLVIAAVALGYVVSSGSSAGSRGSRRAGATRTADGPAAVTRRRTTTPRNVPSSRPRPQTYGVGLRVMRFVDPTRSISLPDGASVPRTLVTDVRYPTTMTAHGRADIANAPVARTGRPFPLIVFGHGFDVTPGLYALLLRAWARAGYVVAAPAFPRESPDAPGGPDEDDLPNQPADMSFVITRMLAASAAGGPWQGTIDPRAIAVAGQSDGGDTALAVADDPSYRDHRVDAAIILSGAEIPYLPSFAIPPGSPPLLAIQGTADPINPLSATLAFYDGAPRPKFLLRLPGAGHLPPYSVPGPQLTAVERVSISFLNDYLRHERGALRRMRAAGTVPGVAQLDAEP